MIILGELSRCNRQSNNLTLSYADQKQSSEDYASRLQTSGGKTFNNNSNQKNSLLKPRCALFHHSPHTSTVNEMFVIRKALVS